MKLNKKELFKNIDFRRNMEINYFCRQELISTNQTALKKYDADDLFL